MISDNHYVSLKIHVEIMRPTAVFYSICHTFFRIVLLVQLGTYFVLSCFLNVVDSSWSWNSPFFPGSFVLHFSSSLVTFPYLDYFSYPVYNIYLCFSLWPTFVMSYPYYLALYQDLGIYETYSLFKIRMHGIFKKMQVICVIWLNGEKFN